MYLVCKLNLNYFEKKRKLMIVAGSLAIVAMATVNFYIAQYNESDQEVDLLLSQIEIQAVSPDIDRLPQIDNFLAPREYYCNGRLYGRICIDVEDQTSYCNMNWERPCE